MRQVRALKIFSGTGAARIPVFSDVGIVER